MKKKPVSAEKYTKKYFLTKCDGYKEFFKNWGNKPSLRLKSVLSKIRISKNEKILDIGCGRGETAVYLAKKGACVYAVDYSKTAIMLAKKAVKKQKKDIREKITLKTMNAKKLEFKDNFFDKVIMLEVWEHLHTWEQEKVLKQVKKVLKKEGRAFIHTEPSKLVNKLLYPYWIYPVSKFLITIWNKIFKKNYTCLPHPALLNDHFSQNLHVNEPTYFQLKKVFKKANFKKYKIRLEVDYKKPLISWKDRIYNFLVLLSPLSDYFPLNTVFANDFFITLEK
jgi:cyclopropane fatty-acyl-phospholipid synthase-like methyltransferase